MLAVQDFSWLTLTLLAVGGYCLVGSSNAFNQVIERDLDALMKRTMNRPLPTGAISVNMAMVIAVGMGLMGLIILYTINPITSMFGAISLFLYTSVYTPLKTKTPLSVFVGAFPGAIPFMLGWVAATGEFGIEAGMLFLIQFLWQFPHFWAIGWCLDDDYRKGGFQMLPFGGTGTKTAQQILLYTVWTIVVSLIPVLGVTGRFQISIVAAVLVLAIGVWFLSAAYKLYKVQDAKTARRLMLVSVTYITLLQIIYVSDRFISF